MNYPVGTLEPEFLELIDSIHEKIDYIVEKTHELKKNSKSYLKI